MAAPSLCAVFLLYAAKRRMLPKGAAKNRGSAQKGRHKPEKVINIGEKRMLPDETAPK